MMKRFLSLLIAVCLAVSLCGAVSAEATARTSRFSSAASCAELEYLFENFSDAAAANAGHVTVGMVITAVGRYLVGDVYAGPGVGYTNGSDAVLLDSANDSGNIIRRLPAFAELTVMDLADGWFHVSVDGTQGYMSAESITAVCRDYPSLPYGAWYSPYMIWAAGLGLENLPEPGHILTRGELAQLLCDIMAAAGFSLPFINEAYPFTDSDVFTAGLDAAQTLQRAGVLPEKTDGSFGPGEAVSLSELQSILLRFLPALQADKLDLRQVPVSTVPESAPVDDSWFDDACFIGHSQIVGLRNNYYLPNTDFYAVVGHKAKDVVAFEYYELPDRSYGTLSKGLDKAQYGKIYIMLGINDCTGNEKQLERYLTSMHQLLTMVQDKQPDAKIYLISLAPVGRETPNNLCYNLEYVLEFTQALKSLAREYGTEYLDVFRLMCDEEGYFQGRFNAGDGIHIDPHRYDEIMDYLRSHT